MKAPAFARTIGIGETTFRNYIDRDSKPSSEVLEKISNSFENVNIVWLVTGRGEPFLTQPIENTLPATNAKKISRNQIVGTNHGTAYQEHNNNPSSDEALKTKLTLAEKEIEHLRALLASKDQTIEALKTAIRP